MCFVFASPAVAHWQIETADSVDGMGEYSQISLALDSNNNPNVSYGNFLPGGLSSYLKYAKWTGSSWSTQTVDSGGLVGAYSSIALDSNDNPHISYIDSTNGTLKYAKWTGSSWSTQTVDVAELEDISIALDSNNNPHIVYTKNSAIKYAKWTGSAWSTQTVISDWWNASGPSIALDSNNDPHITYHVANTYQNTNGLNYAKWTGSSWSMLTVASDGGRSSIALDSNNNPYISYIDTNLKLKFAKWTGVSWLIQTVGSVNSSPGFTSIAIDSNSIPYISYRNNNGYLICTKLMDDSLLTQTIDTSWVAANSIALDANNNPSVIYIGGGLKYAKFANNSPILTWANEVNYIADGLNPEVGDRSTSFVFRVKYADADNDAPYTGYPKLHIKQSGSEILGSPFVMPRVSGTQSSGIYSYSKVLTVPGTDYAYYFEAQDAYNAVSTGTPIVIMNGPSVTNSTPTLAWTGETNYTADGLEPGTAHAGSTCIFRVKYTDLDGDAPATGYPLVHVFKNSVELAGSPFAMSLVSGTPASSAIYTYSKVLISTGTDYTYYFEAQDAYNAVSTGTPVVIMTGPSVTNAVPVLIWTGEANYTTDGINPNTGDPTTSFVFRVKYSDTDSDAPYSGYPKLHIKKGGVEIGDSPFTMNFVSGSNGSGATYTYTKSLTSTGSDYTYYFEAKDAYNADATGTPLTPVSGPIVSNHAPTLAWTGEANYTADGLDPESGDRNTNFMFRVKYADADNQAPNTGYPRLHIKQGGIEISGSPFGMTGADAGDTVYTDGKLYTYTKTLLPGIDYTYYFEAQDSDGVDATGIPTTQIDAPDVSNQVPALAWTGETNYSAGGLFPLKGNPTDTYVFRVKYTDADNDAPGTGYPRVRIKKSGADISGSPFAMNYVSGANNAGAIYSLSKTLAAGAYVYSFDALDLYGGQATGEPLAEQSGPVVIGADLPPAQEVKVYHGVFKPGENEKTNISFNTTAPVSITVTVYNNIGRKVIELYHGTSSAGLNLIQWDGKNDSGQRVSSGVYTIKIEGGGMNQSKRVVVVR